MVGVRGHTTGTRARFEERAPIVIGADGMSSVVARLAGAPTYDEVPTRTAVYWSYWSGVPLETGSEGYFRPRRFCVAVSTNDGMSIIMVYLPIDEFASFKRDVAGSFLGTWREHVPSFYEKIMAGRQEEGWLGTGHQPNHFHKPYGEGWALVGDADIHHDSMNPSGISYAFINAEYLAAAVDDGLSGRRPMQEALADYEKRRYDRWSRHYRFITESATNLALPPSPQMEALIGSVLQDDDVATRFIGFFQGMSDYMDFMGPDSGRGE